MFALAYAYVSFTFSLFPSTRGYADVLLGYVLYPLRVVGEATVAFVPNLFFIAVILVVAYYLTKVIRFSLLSWKSRQSRFPGFIQSGLSLLIKSPDCW